MSNACSQIRTIEPCSTVLQELRKNERRYFAIPLPINPLEQLIPYPIKPEDMLVPYLSADHTRGTKGTTRE